MAASRRRADESWVRLVITAAFCALAFQRGALSDDSTATGAGTMTIITVPPELLDILLRGDGDPGLDLGDGSDAPGVPGVTPKEDASGGSVTHDPQHTVDVQTLLDQDGMVTPGDVMPEGTGGEGEPMDGIHCVDKDAIGDKDLVKLELKDSSTCEETKAKLREMMKELCGKDCNIQIYQEDGSSQIIMSGDDIEADAKGMAQKFTSQGIKEKLGVKEANPKWGKHPQTVLVTLLLLGLLLAAGLIGGYCLRNRRQPAKGPKLAEDSFPMDQENQGNTLVSVAPLHPQEPQEKPSANGESPDGVKTESPPTNGHSTAKTADTEL